MRGGAGRGDRKGQFVHKGGGHTGRGAWQCVWQEGLGTAVLLLGGRRCRRVWGQARQGGALARPCGEGLRGAPGSQEGWRGTSIRSGQCGRDQLTGTQKRLSCHLCNFQSSSGIKAVTCG